MAEKCHKLNYEAYSEFCEKWFMGEQKPDAETTLRGSLQLFKQNKMA
jgi:hypothetical protein